MRPQPLLLIAVFVSIVAGLSACAGVDGHPLAEALAVDARPAPTSQPAPRSAAEPKPAASASDTQQPPAHGPALFEILEYSPANTSAIEFTDWLAVKDRLGLSGLDSSAGEEARMSFLQGLRNEAPASMYDSRFFLDHAASWGWDSLDLAWEARLNLDGSAPVYVLRFQNSDPIDRLRSILESREFESGSYAGVPIYTHELDLTADWIRTAEFSILNVAILEPQPALVLSSSPDALRAVLASVTRETTLAVNNDARSAVQTLGHADTGIVVLGADACLSFEVNPLLNMLGEDDVSAEAAQEELERVMPVRPQSLYTALALGLTRDSAQAGEPVWKVVMHHPTEELAQIDLPQRRIIAEQGMSAVREMPNQDLFTVQDAQVQGQDAVLWLASVTGNASLLIQMFYMRDLAFLACP
jgi:hypothetical protein